MDDWCCRAACRNPDDAQLPSGCPGRRRIPRWRFSWGVGGGGFRGGGFGGFRGGGFGGFHGGGFGRFGGFRGASDVSVVVDSDVVSDSTVGMVGVITPTTTDAIIRVWTHDMAEELEHWQMDASPYRSQSESPWDVLIAQAVNWDIPERLAA